MAGSGKDSRSGADGTGGFEERQPSGRKIMDSGWWQPVETDKLEQAETSGLHGTDGLIRAGAGGTGEGNSSLQAEPEARGINGTECRRVVEIERGGADCEMGDYCDVVKVNESFLLVPVEGRTSALGFGHVELHRQDGTLSCHVAKGTACSEYAKKEGKGSKQCTHTLLALWALQGAGTQLPAKKNPKELNRAGTDAGAQGRQSGRSSSLSLSRRAPSNTLCPLQGRACPPSAPSEASNFLSSHSCFDAPGNPYPRAQKAGELSLMQ